MKCFVEQGKQVGSNGKSLWRSVIAVAAVLVAAWALAPSLASAASVDPYSEIEATPFTATPPSASNVGVAGEVGNNPLAPSASKALTAPSAPPAGTAPAGQPGTRPASPSAAAASQKKFSGTKCARRGHLRVCRTYKQGTVVKTCKAAGKHPLHCTRAKQHAAATASSVGSDKGFTNAIPPVGKFFRSNLGRGVSSHCSGTLFANGLVITAAHCLYANAETAPEAGFTGYHIQHETLWFAADETFAADGGSDINSASAPYNYLKVVNSWVPQCWAEGNPDCDYGVAELQPYADGSYVGSYTHTFPLMWNYGAPTGSQFYLFGYPASNAFAYAANGYGDRPYYCNDTYDAKVVQIGSTRELAASECNATGGISGGPVFTRASDGNWYVVGVVNRGATQNTTGQLSPQQEWNSWVYWNGSFGSFICGNFPICR
jgi:V8-like Glu-specific endopeptidase